MIALGAGVFASGCSFIFSEGAPDDHRARATFQCGESPAPPILDTVGAGYLTFRAIGLERDKESTVAAAARNGQDPVQVRHDVNVSIGVSAAFAALDVASAIYGFYAVHDCRRAQETRLAEVAQARWLPPPYGVPPYGEPPPFWPPVLYAPPAAPAAPAPEAPAPATPAPPAPAPPATPSP
jgi:hypothetical protein